MAGIVLIIDDNVSLAKNISILLQVEGYQAEAAHTAAQGRKRMEELDPDIVLMDLKLPDGDGAELIGRFKEEFPEAQFIMITAHGSIRSAVECTRRGAIDYLTKPFESEDLLITVRNAMQERTLSEEVRRLRSGRSLKSRGEEAYSSPAMGKFLALARRVAEQDGIVLLTGESGAGKDYMARWLHDRSPRAGGPFFSINCAALSRELAESELFGHEPGAFTGARGRKRGLLELAEKGTLFLNEIGDLDPALQSKLLTFLDTKSFVRVGGERSVAVDARIFAATNRDLAEAVERGEFRKDLFYRLNVMPLELPPLRERSRDIPVLAGDILDKLTVEIGLKSRPRISPEALEALENYSWPGNIRELRNVLEHALLVAQDDEIGLSQLNIETGDGPGNAWKLEVEFPTDRTLHDVTKEVARELIAEALRRGKSIKRAAELLNITRNTLVYQMRALDIDS